MATHVAAVAAVPSLFWRPAHVNWVVFGAVMLGSMAIALLLRHRDRVGGASAAAWPLVRLALVAFHTAFCIVFSLWPLFMPRHLDWMFLVVQLPRMAIYLVMGARCPLDTLERRMGDGTNAGRVAPVYLDVLNALRILTEMFLAFIVFAQSFGLWAGGLLALANVWLQAPFLTQLIHLCYAKNRNTVSRYTVQQ